MTTKTAIQPVSGARPPSDLQLPDGFVDEVAVGMMPFDDICSSYEINPALWRDNHLLRTRVNERQRELRNSGKLIEHKANFVTELVLNKASEMVATAMLNPTELVKLNDSISKLTTLARKKEETASQSAGVSFVIQFPDGNSMVAKSHGRTIDQEDDGNGDDNENYSQKVGDFVFEVGENVLKKPPEWLKNSQKLDKNAEEVVDLDDAFSELKEIFG